MERHGTTVCHDADSRLTLRAGVHRMSLAAPRETQALTKCTLGS